MGNLCCSDSVQKLSRNKVIITPAKLNEKISSKDQQQKSPTKLIDGNYHQIRTIGILKQGEQRTVSLVSVNQKIRGSSISEKQFKLFVMACEKSVKYSFSVSRDQQLSTRNSIKTTTNIDLKAIYPLKYTYQDEVSHNQIYELQKDNDLPTYFEYITPEMLQFLLAAVVLKIQQDHIYGFRYLKAENILLDQLGYPAIMNQAQSQGLSIWALSLFDQYSAYLKIPYTDQFVTSGCFRQIHYERKDQLKDHQKKLDTHSLQGFIENSNLSGKKLLHQIKHHNFFNGIDWDAILSKQYESPFFDIIQRHNKFNESIFNQNY